MNTHHANSIDLQLAKTSALSNTNCFGIENLQIAYSCNAVWLLLLQYNFKALWLATLNSLSVNSTCELFKNNYFIKIVR